MLFRDSLDLLTTEEGTNDNGFEQINIKSRRTVFANKKDVRQSEFYQAATQGIKLDTMFAIRSVEYNGEKILEHDGIRYNIIRTYDKNGELTELICSSKEVI